jgi:hypothetical protein
VYGRFEGAPSVDDPVRFFVLDDEDRQLVARHRGDYQPVGVRAAVDHGPVPGVGSVTVRRGRLVAEPVAVSDESLVPYCDMCRVKPCAAVDRLR